MPIGILIGVYRSAEAMIEPLVDFIRYMPVVGFVPLTIIWIGIGDSQKWSIVFIGTFFQEVLLVMDNVKRVPKELVDIGQTLGLKDVGILRRIILRAGGAGHLGHAAHLARLGLDVDRARGAGRGEHRPGLPDLGGAAVLQHRHDHRLPARAGPAGPHHRPGDEGDGSLDVPVGRAMTAGVGSGAPLLTIRGVAKTFPGRPPVEALSPVDLDLAENEFVSLVGTSGCGKSTLLAHRGRPRRADRAAWCWSTGIPVTGAGPGPRRRVPDVHAVSRG